MATIQYVMFKSMYNRIRNLRGNVKCARCSKGIKVGDSLLATQSGKHKAKRYHMRCAKKIGITVTPK